METERQKNLLEDTAHLQQAIEKIVDEDTQGLPLSPETSRQRGSAKQPDSGQSPVHSWFFTFMCMNIPIVGWIYLFYLASGRSRTDRRNFAKAYLYYKLVFLIVSAVILGILIAVGLNVLDRLLAYMELL